MPPLPGRRQVVTPIVAGSHLVVAAGADSMPLGGGLYCIGAGRAVICHALFACCGGLHCCCCVCCVGLCHVCGTCHWVCGAGCGGFCHICWPLCCCCFHTALLSRTNLPFSILFVMIHPRPAPVPSGSVLCCALMHAPACMCASSRFTCGRW